MDKNTRNIAIVTASILGAAAGWWWNTDKGKKFRQQNQQRISEWSEIAATKAIHLKEQLPSPPNFKEKSMLNFPVSQGSDIQEVEALNLKVASETQEENEFQKGMRKAQERIRKEMEMIDKGL